MFNRTTPASGQESDAGYIGDQISALNSQRITRVLAILLLVHVAHVVLFWPYTPGASDKTHLWRNGIIIAHCTMILVIAVLLPSKIVLERKARLSTSHLGAMSGLISLLYLLFGAVLAITDQLVTGAITPLLMASIGVALALVVRPLVAAFNYALVLVVFTWGVTWTQASPDILLTTRVNSITALSLGFILAVLQWRYQTRAMQQQRRIEDQQRELEEANRQLTRLATLDPLTGLLNRAQFALEAHKQIANLDRTRSRACLVMLDLDYFKVINDTYGHPAGDSLLVELARVLTRVLRASDPLARFGGEEFAILLPDTQLEDGVRVAEQLRGAIETHSFFFGAELIKITATFGVAELVEDHPDAYEHGYHAADNALYRAKKDGRNCVRYAPRENSDGTSLNAG